MCFKIFLYFTNLTTKKRKAKTLSLAYNKNIITKKLQNNTQKQNKKKATQLAQIVYKLVYASKFIYFISKIPYFISFLIIFFYLLSLL